ncbi:DUF4129 domain-containing protein [Streptomyces chumphonensis]|uniref:DUF4129 domain-containing protein n=1 Tax=Streptomyces chumphonensis TaxID=1214925 RepID=UPI002963D83D|nr:DUF4129 domain-containing protein [Streptomyces chumphonensis]
MTAVSAGGPAVASAAPVPRGDDDVPVTIGREAAREAAERELSEPGYRADEPGPAQRALEWVLERLDDILGSALALTPGGWAGLLVIALVVVALLIALRLRLGALRRPEQGRPGSLFDAAPRSAADHREAAERHAATGAWGPAIQERMRAVVRALEERALLDPRPGRTADEAAAEADRALPGHAGPLLDAARAFDEVTYAHRPGTRTAYEELRALDLALATARPRPAAAGQDGGSR